MGDPETRLQIRRPVFVIGVRNMSIVATCIIDRGAWWARLPKKLFSDSGSGLEIGTGSET